MSLRDSQFGELKVPLTWTAAVALIVAAVVAIALLLTDRRETFRPEAYGQARSTVDSVLAPVGNALSAPGRWTGAGVDAVRNYFFAVSENHRLKAELSEMRQWHDVALALKNENGRFRSLLGLKTDPPIPMVAARVVVDSRGPFADTRIANAGREAGVVAGNPVMSEYGLVGRVIGVTSGASRVLMLTDAASRTPVMIDRTNARAILSGDGGPNPRLDYLRGQDPVREGDRVLTSGDGGIVPRGLPVGFAVKGLDGKWRVVLASDKGPIDFVRILLFQDFTQLVNRKDLDELPVPPPTPGEPADLAAQAAAAAEAQVGVGGTAAKPGTPGAAVAASGASATGEVSASVTPKALTDQAPSEKTAADKGDAAHLRARDADADKSLSAKPAAGKADAAKSSTPKASAAKSADAKSGDATSAKTSKTTSTAKTTSGAKSDSAAKSATSTTKPKPAVKPASKPKPPPKPDADAQEPPI